MNLYSPFLLLSLFAAISVPASVRSYRLPSGDFSDWTARGVSQTDLAKQSAFTLPAGAELVRGFYGGSVMLAVGSTPHFAQAPTDWPVLQVGPTAVVFTREGAVGRLALVVNETARMLPAEIALDQNGRAREPVELVLGFDPVMQRGAVGFDGQVIAFSTDAVTGAVEVALSAGASQEWPQDWVEVLVLGPDGDNHSPEELTSASHETGSSARELLQSVADMLGKGEPVGTASGKDGSAPVPVVATASSMRPTLEVFTPPAVRLGAESVRAILAAAQNK